MLKNLQRISLFLVFFSLNFEVYDPFYTDGAFSIAKLMAYIYVLLMAPSILKFRTPDAFKPFLRTSMLFLILLTLINIFNIRYGHTDFFEFSLLQNILLFWILMNHEAEDPMVLEKGLLGFAAGSVTLSVLYPLGIGVGFSDDGRVSIFGTNENEIGIRMCVSLIYIILLVMQNRGGFGWTRYFFLAGTPFLFSLLIASGSRMAFLAFALAFVSIVVLYKTKQTWVKGVLVFAGVVGIVLLWQYLIHSEVVAQRLIETVEDGDLSQRDEIWRTVLPVWTNNPIFGVGRTGYEFFSSWQYGEFMSPHNVIIEVLCFSGVAGLIIYLVFLYRIALLGWQTYREQGYLLQLLLFLPIGGMLLSGHLLYVKIGWVIFAYIAGSALYLKKESIKLQENEDTLCYR